MLLWLQFWWMGKVTDLKAWTTTVPNKMNKAEKMRDRRGIISRLQINTETHLKSSLFHYGDKYISINPK